MLSSLYVLVLKPGTRIDRPKQRFLHLCGFLDESRLTGSGSQPYAQPQTGGSDLRFYVLRRQGVPSLPRTLCIHFSHVLRQAWAVLGLFLFPATTWEKYVLRLPIQGYSK